MSPSFLDEMRDALCESVDDVFAEPIRMSFMAGGKLDPSRPQIEIEAVLRVGSNKTTNESSTSSRVWRSRIAAGKAELHIDRASYSVGKVVVGDRCRALSREGEPLFQVESVDDRAWPRLILHLGEA